MLIGGIEAGGTKFVCSVGTGPDDLGEESRFPTTTPEETLGRSIAFFKEQETKYGALDAIGVAAFGPLDPDPKSPTFGYITSTPKPGWANTDFVGALKAEFDTPIGFDTDVNGAALSEGKWGAAQGLNTFVYLTIGTGVGGGAVVNGTVCCMAWFTLKWAIFASATTGKRTPTLETAPIMATASKAWPPARPSKNAGA